MEASGQEGKNATTGYLNTNVEARILKFGVQNEQPKNVSNSRNITIYTRITTMNMILF